MLSGAVRHSAAVRNPTGVYLRPAAPSEAPATCTDLLLAAMMLLSKPNAQQTDAQNKPKTVNKLVSAFTFKISLLIFYSILH